MSRSPTFRLAAVEAQKESFCLFRPICPPTPYEKRRPYDVHFGSYDCSAGRYIIVRARNRITR